MITDPKREEQATAEWAHTLMGEIARAVSSESGGSTWIDPDDYSLGARAIAAAFAVRLAEITADLQAASERISWLEAERDAALVRIQQHERGYGLIRRGGAVAVTIPQQIPGFRGFRYCWWDRALEVPFPEWRTA